MKMAEGGGIRRQKPPKLTMEDYLDFIHSNKQLDLTVPHLNQIIDMHGFRKMYKAHKSDLMEAVKIMELMDPSRSTLEDTAVSSDAFITLDELINDIKELQWQECCITSLQTINAVGLQNQISNNESNSMALTVTSASSEKPKRPRKKFKKLADNSAVGGDLSSTSFDSGGALRASCSPLAMKLAPKKKSALKDINLNPIDNHGDGGLGGSAVSVTDLQPLESSSSAFLKRGSY